MLPDARVDADGDVVIGTGRPRASVRTQRPGARSALALTPSERDVVFVLPALWAVGGVERLAIEVMRQQISRYCFVVVTTERLTATQGSLHHELRELGIASYDLAELAPPSSHLSMLDDLKQAYDPGRLAVQWIDVAL